MILDQKEKQPADIKDYPISYADWLAKYGDTLSDANAVVTCLSTPADTALVVNSVTIAPTAVSVWLSGGTAGERYKVEVTVDTAGTRRDQSEFIVRVKDY